MIHDRDLLIASIIGASEAILELKADFLNRMTLDCRLVRAMRPPTGLDSLPMQIHSDEVLEACAAY